MFVDNKTKDLKTDSNADLIFKKGDYLHTYVIIETSGIPDGATLYLLDENLNQLYSPYNINGNQIKSPCFIISGETDALQLPASYDENQYTDFVAGTYNWKLRYEGGSTFFDKIIPITVEIRDFNLETNLTPEIYPNEDIQIQLKTYVDTPISLNEFDNDRLTTNAIYDNTTGIITYPNSDITDLSVGEHTQIINQAKNYNFNYIVKNPIKIYIVPETAPYQHNLSNYSNNQTTRLVGIYLTDTNLYPVTGGIKNLTSVYINGVSNNLNSSITGGYPSNDTTVFKAIRVQDLPPGTYNCEVQGNTNNCSSTSYTDTGVFRITTESCYLSINRDSHSIYANYTYSDGNNIYYIPNASIQFFKDNILIDTKITDSNGQCSIQIDDGTFIAKAIDYDGTVLLESNTLSL